MGIKNSYFGLTMDKAEGKILQAVGKWVKKYSDRSTEKEKKEMKNTYIKIRQKVFLSNVNESRMDVVVFKIVNK